MNLTVRVEPYNNAMLTDSNIVNFRCCYIAIYLINLKIIKSVVLGANREGECIIKFLVLTYNHE